MNKYVLSFFLLLIAASVMAQKAPVKKSRVELISSEKAELMKGPDGKTIAKVRKGVFKQDFSILRSDSALFYKDQNMVDAFGHVNINQGDTLNIFSDKLNYNGNTKLAILTGNVKMVDKDATLTTNYLTYNTATRIGTYTGGGKLVNKDNTLVSKNGYYFAYSRDTYFRYDVVSTTPDAIIKTDTMRYNSGTRITYFYGPTNIYGKKDKDTLYTENGTYNNNTEQALFGKKNAYRQGSKSLKGDSLFYDRVKGYGRATKNVTFNDNEQKITIKGNLGEYYKADERAIITQNAYMIFVTEEKDTTAAKTPLPVAVTKPLPKPAATDTTKKQPVVKLLNQPDSLNKLAKAPEKIKRDSLFMVADTLETQVLAFKDYKALKQERWLANNRDTSIKIVRSAPIKVAPKVLTIAAPKMPVDTSLFHKDIFGKPKPKVTAPKKPVVVKAVPKLTAKDSLRIKIKADSLELIANHGLRDTSRIRIVSAFHNAKLFKSDLQAVADSMFYSSSDSIIRSFVKPMMWTQGSQLSGDTITLQMKNKKLDNIDLFPKGFIVNIEKNDSLHFNQLSGKKIHGVFKENKLNYMLVTSNVETRYFKRDSATNIVTDMASSTSGALRVNFNNGQLRIASFIQNPENRIYAIDKVKEEDKILKNFIWKPKDRPVSKESILPPLTKPIPAKKPAVKSAAKKPTTQAPVKKTAVIKPTGSGVATSAVKDTTVKQVGIKPDTVKKDTVKKK